MHCGYHATGRSAAFWLESYGGPDVARLTAASRRFPRRAARGFRRARFLRAARRAPPLASDDWPEVPAGGRRARRIDRARARTAGPGHAAAMDQGLVRAELRRHRRRRLHAACLRAVRRSGGDGRDRRRAALGGAHGDGRWHVETGRRRRSDAAILVNAAGAWADEVAERCGVAPLGIAPKRRTMVQLRVGRIGPQGPAAGHRLRRQLLFQGRGRQQRLGQPARRDRRPTRATPRPRRSTSPSRSTASSRRSTGRSRRSSATGRAFGPSRPTGCRFTASIRAAPGFFWCAGQGGLGSRPRRPRRCCARR